MNLMIKLSAGLFLTTILPGTAYAGGSINGQWVTQDKDAIVTITKCGRTLCGRISKYLVTPPNGVNQRDTKNPNKKLRNRKLMGIAVLTGFKPDGKIWRGRIYDPKTGKSYRSEVSLQSPSKLKVKGCIAFFCRGQNWTRAR